MNWTGGRLRRHSEINAKSRKQTFGKTSAASKDRGPHQISLFNNIIRHRGGDEKSGLDDNGTTAIPGLDSRNKTTENLPLPSQPTSNNGTDSKPPDRLERIKRQLLETADWGAVGAARPVQVAFTPQEDLERFGKRRRLTKDDHERLNTSIAVPPRPRGEAFVGAQADVPENLEIRIDGRRLGERDAMPSQQDAAVNQDSHPSAISSQSMLLDRDSPGLNLRLNVENIPRNGNSRSRSTRSASRLSMLSNDHQLDYLTEIPLMTGRQPDGQGILHRNLSGSMDWVPEERVLDPRQSNESSLIIPQPESPVRRRFTIDEQAIADSQGKFVVSSPVVERPTTQLWHGQLGHAGSPQNCVIPSLGSSSQTRPRIGIQFQRSMEDLVRSPAPQSSIPRFGWLPQTHRGLQQLRGNQAAGRSVTQAQERNNLWTNQTGESQPSPVRIIYGQPIVFEEPDVDADGCGREQSGQITDFDAGLQYPDLSSGDAFSSSLGSPLTKLEKLANRIPPAT
ncbi:uncharacterized protein DSM5745_09196 [Aspergillus mulundensis]|uniref:Uncharacterized protein n=1 Tax=Aspergillus mulundensis TaxID=1810919 RepID=A0A3D8R090_9EURO|nr:hypothetical protein DSM5745_09196 [Aspergillus mulundensis]RDW67330.1 hypothetical protein DSM5745_09196 [Aspergillus mulundensis]